MNRAEKRRQQKQAGMPSSANTYISPSGQKFLNDAIGAFNAGDPIRAQNLCQKVLGEVPRHPIAMSLQGAATLALGNAELAVELLRKVVGEHPKMNEAHIFLGNALMSLGQHDDAAKHFRRAAILCPGSIEANVNLGNVLQEQGRLQEAVTVYRKALDINRGLVDTHFSLGLALQSLGRLEDATKSFKQALELNPHHAEALLHAGITYKDQESYDLAIEHLRKARDLHPGDARMHLNLGVALKESGALSEAITCYREALKINPEYVEAYINLGNALQESTQLHEALACHRKALELNPISTAALNGMGYVLEELGELDQAEESFKASIDACPSHYRAQLNLGLLQLLRGNFKAAWPNYEARLLDHNGKNTCAFDKPVWTGEDLSGKGLGILVEQGIGDQILYAILFSDFDLSNTKLVVECDPRLLPVYARSFEGVTLVPKTTPRNPALKAKNIDFQVSVGSILQYLRPDPSRHPASKAFFKADGDVTQKLRNRYREWSGGRPIVGISWYSGNKALSSRKSLTLGDWRPILACPDCAFVSLQYGDVAADLATLKDQTGIEVYLDTEIDPLKDMDGFAAQVAAMDLVISISNATVHMSGALGVETWLMVPQIPPIWYWQLTREDSIWYENFKLFRQNHPSDWFGVVEQVSSALEKHF